MLSESLLPEFDHEMALTRAVLERLPDDALAWKPHDRSYSLGDLATHIVNLPTWVGPTIEQDELDLGTPFPPPPSGDRDALLAHFDANVAAAREKLTGCPDATLMAPWTLRTGDQVHMTLPRIGVLRSFVLSHLIHHRGQLTVYLRLRDVPLPSVYGPTADEASF